MSKYELDGYQPLRPWVRGASYGSFIVGLVVALIECRNGTSLQELVAYHVGVSVLLICAVVAFCDARTAALLRRRGVRRVPVGFAQPPFTFFEKDEEWDYLNDKNPETARK